MQDGVGIRRREQPLLPDLVGHLLRPTMVSHGVRRGSPARAPAWGRKPISSSRGSRLGWRPAAGHPDLEVEEGLGRQARDRGRTDVLVLEGPVRVERFERAPQVGEPAGRRRPATFRRTAPARLHLYRRRASRHRRVPTPASEHHRAPRRLTPPSKTPIVLRGSTRRGRASRSSSQTRGGRRRTPHSAGARCRVRTRRDGAARSSTSGRPRCRDSRPSRSSTST